MWFDLIRIIHPQKGVAREVQDLALRSPVGIAFLAMVLMLMTPDLLLAQAASPFMTGATALQTNILAWLTPVAVILVMVRGAMAMANRTAGNARIPQVAPSVNSRSWLTQLRVPHRRSMTEAEQLTCPQRGRGAEDSRRRWVRGPE